MRHATSFYVRGNAFLGSLAALLIASCASNGSGGKPAAHYVPPEISAAITAGQPQEVLIELDRAAILPAELAPGAKPTLEGQALTDAKAKFYAEAKADLLKGHGGIDQLNEYPHLPMMFARINTADALAYLMNHPAVRQIHANEQFEAASNNGLTDISASVASGRGDIGTGESVVVIDTGVDYTQAAFGSCTAPGVPSACAVIVEQSCQNAVPCAASMGTLDTVGHGTNVAGIVASVAPGAKIISLNVFTGSLSNPSAAAQLTAQTSDIVDALEYVAGIYATDHVAAINMSLGSSTYSSNCDGTSVFTTLIDDFVGVGVAVVASSGNNAQTSKITDPACNSEAISVGAVYDANVGAISFSAAGCQDTSTAVDKVACYSNSAPFLTLLAPGGPVDSAGQTGYYGTSMAAAYVSGAVAVLKAAFPTNTLQQIRDRLTGGGKLITDARNTQITPRLNLGTSTNPCLHAISPTNAAPVQAGAMGQTIAVDDTSTSPCAYTLLSNQSWLTITSGLSSAGGSGTITYTVAANPGGTPRTGTITLSSGMPSAAEQVFTVVQQGSGALPCSGSFACSMAVNGGTMIGGHNYTTSTAVTLSFSGTGPNGVQSYCVTNGATCQSSFVNYLPPYTNFMWTIPGGSGLHPVSVIFKDQFGNQSALVSGSIYLDNTPPTASAMTASATDSPLGHGQVTLKWTLATDAGSGVFGYKVVSGGTSPPANCSSGTPIYSGPGVLTTPGTTPPTYTATDNGPFADGATYYYLVCAQDNLGNANAGSPANVRVAPADPAPPTGTLTFVSPPYTSMGINYTGSSTVTLAATATGTPTFPVTQVCVSNTTSCTAWQGYPLSPSVNNWTLPGGSGTKTVYASFGDTYNDYSGIPFTSASIVLDTTPPTATTLTTIGAANSVTLNWTASTDPAGGSGLAGYKAVYSGSSPPTSCSVGTPVTGSPFSSATLSATQGGLTPGSTYYFLVCPFDNVLNATVTASGSASQRASPEFDLPTGVGTAINGGVMAGMPTALYTGSTAITLNLAATVSSVDHALSPTPANLTAFCVSNSSTCTSWTTIMTPGQTYTNASFPWTLNSGTGPKTVTVWYRDTFNNVSAPIPLTINLDQTPPTTPMLTVTGGTAANTLTLNWTASSDVNSGMLLYEAFVSATAIPPTCATGTGIYVALDVSSAMMPLTSVQTTINSLPLANGSTYYYRLCAMDKVFNTSSSTGSARVAPNYTQPTVPTFTISATNGVSKGMPAVYYVPTIGVTLDIVGASVNTTASMQMCVSNQTVCTPANNGISTGWIPYVALNAASMAWNLSVGQGARTVNVWLQDQYGNINTTPASANAYVDIAPPVDGMFTATPSSNSVALVWTAANDGSGVGVATTNGYKVVRTAALPAPTNCSGTAFYLGSALATTDSTAMNGTTYYYRVCSIDAVGNMSTGVAASARPAPEYNPPVMGSVAVNGGITYMGTRYVNSPSVTLTLGANVMAGSPMGTVVQQMCISNTMTCQPSAWQSYSTLPINWTLASGDGPKVVYAWFADNWGNPTTTPVASASVTLDTTPPGNVALMAVQSSGQVALTWPTVAVDPAPGASGLAGYKLVYNTSAAGFTSAPANCSTGTAISLMPVTSQSYTHSPLPNNGTTYYYRLCPYDNAGNVGTGMTAQGRPASEYTAPSGTVTIGGGTMFSGTNYIANQNVTLTFSGLMIGAGATITQVCISNTATCSAWQPWNSALPTTVPWVLTSGSGPKTVSVWFSDSQNNVSLSAAVANITLDTAGPVLPTLSVMSQGNATVTLGWPAATDVGGPGLATNPYTLVYTTSFSSQPTAGCGGGTPFAISGTPTSATLNSLTNGATYYFMLCATDKLGVTSAGATVTARPATFYMPLPTGTITSVGHVTGGVNYVGSRNVTFNITGSGGDTANNNWKVCIEDTSPTNCTTGYQPFIVGGVATPIQYTIGPNSPDTVYAFFEDDMGNFATTPVSTVVRVDSTLPTDGTLSFVNGSATTGVVTANWTAATDALATVASYILEYTPGATPPIDCSGINGTVIYSGALRTFTNTSNMSPTLTSGSMYSYRVCAVNGVGNVSLGATGTNTAP